MLRALTDYRYWFDAALGTDPAAIGNEQDCYDLDHAQIAAALVESWEFDAAVVQAVGHHHGLQLDVVPEGPVRHLLALLLLADQVASRSRAGPVPEHDAPVEDRIMRQAADALETDLDRVRLTLREADKFVPRSS
jgi:HD-like signal output (HDOD) protein